MGSQTATEARSKWKTAGGILTALAAATVLLAYVQSTLRPDTIDRITAQQFLRTYYGDTTADPATCCYNDLDSTFQEAKAGSQATYTKFFRQFSAIYVSQVRPDLQHPGYFKATLVYHFKNGTVSKPEVDSFELTCDTITRLPIINCGTDDVKIHDVISPNGL